MNKKFIMRLTFTVIILSLSLILFVNNVKAQVKDNGISYSIVSVKEGDTLWSIVKENCKVKKDIRETIYHIKKINNISSANIIPGQKIKIPSELYK